MKSRRVRSLSITPMLTNTELKKRAEALYCLELALYKEDYENLKNLTNRSKIEEASIIMYKKYFTKNAPLELNLPENLLRDVHTAFTNKEYNILDIVYLEVRIMLHQNLGMIV